MQHKASLGLFDYWVRCRGERAAPRRGDISPAAIQAILPGVIILQRDTAGAFSFTLAGTGVCDLFGRELRRTRLTALWYDKERVAAGDTLEHVVRDGRPAICELVATSRTGRTLSLELLLLPLEPELDGPARLLGALSAAQQPLWLDLDPLQALHTRTVKLFDATARQSQRDEPPRGADTTAIFRSRGTDLTRLQRLTLIEGAKPD